MRSIAPDCCRILLLCAFVANITSIHAANYTAGDNGVIVGPVGQTVPHGGDGVAEGAKPDPGYDSVQWSDGRTDNPRVDQNVQDPVKVTAVFANIVGTEFSLPAFLQDWIDLLRDAGSSTPLDTLAWFRDDTPGLYAYVLSLDWGSTYNFWIGSINGAVQTNAPLVIDCMGRFNLNLEVQGKAIPDVLEFHGIDTILKDDGHPLHGSVKAAYLANLAIWQDYHETIAGQIPQFVPPPPGILYALTAYSTLDTLAGPLAASLYGVHLSRLYGLALPKPPETFTVVDDLHQEADLDGDGFTNLEEWLYIEHQYADSVEAFLNCETPGSGPYSIFEVYTMYLDDDAMIPAYDPATSDQRTPPLVRVALRKEGSGEVTPFEGTRYLSKYNLLDWYAWIADENNDPLVNNPGDVCAGAVLRVEAWHADDWVLQRWELRAGSYGEIIQASAIVPEHLWRLQVPNLVVPLTQSTELTALFECRVEQTALDLVQHLADLLVAVGAIENPVEVWDLDWDLGGFMEEAGNGIPDAAEFYLLQHILESSHLDLTAIRGAHSGIVYAGWRHNMEQIRTDLPLQPSGIQRAVAAYMTLGYGSAIDPLIETHFGVTLDSQQYNHAGSCWLAATGDASGNGVKNLKVWQEASDTGGGAMATIQAFAKKAIDPTPSKSNPKSYSSDENQQKNSAKNEAQGESPTEPSARPVAKPCYTTKEAVIQDDRVFIEEYLSAGGNIDGTDSYGKTLLHYAIETGQRDTIDFLLSKGANAYGFYYDSATGIGSENTPLFKASQLQTECEFAPALCTAIINTLEAAAADVDADSTSIVDNMGSDNISGIMNVLASGKAIHGKPMEQLSWYALENNNFALFTAASQHPSFSLAFTAEEFFDKLVQNKIQYQGWINLMRNHSNRSFYVYVKYGCMDWEDAEDDLLNSLLISACAQGNLDLVNFLLPLGADPTVQVTEEETLLDYIGEDWSQLGFTFPWVLPDWPTDKDTEILQALQAYISSP